MTYRTFTEEKRICSEHNYHALELLAEVTMCKFQGIKRRKAWNKANAGNPGSVHRISQPQSPKEMNSFLSITTRQKKDLKNCGMFQAK